MEKYLDVSYSTLKKQLLEHVKLYYPDSYNDFSEASVGMMLLELNSYVGDILAHSLDLKTNELFIDSAKNRSSLINIGKNLGYTVKGNSGSICVIQLSISVPVSGSSYDSRYAITIERGMKVQSDNGIVFEVLDDIDFNSHTNSVGAKDREIIPTLNSSNEIASYELRKIVQANAGESKVSTLAITESILKPFMSWKIDDNSVLSIRNLVSSTSIAPPASESDWNSTTNVWIPVEYLIDQNVVYRGTELPLSGFHGVVDKKYSTYFDEDGKCYIQFGSGVDNYDIYSTFLASGISSIAQTQMLNNKGFGVLPEIGTYLHCRYRSGGGQNSNIGAGKIKKIVSRNISYIPGLYELGYDSSITNAVVSSLKCSNVTPAIGGRGLESLDEIRMKSKMAYSSQNRCVTIDDYVSMCYNMPSFLSSVFRVGGEFNRESGVVSLYILTLDENGNLKNTDNDLILSTVATYLDKYRMISDVVELKNGIIVNIGVDFSIAVDSGFNKKDVAYSCIETVKSYLNVNNWKMGSTIYLSEIVSLLMNISGVKNVASITLKNIVDDSKGYSKTAISSISDISNYDSSVSEYPISTNNNSLSFPTYAMFEVKYPTKDIICRVV